jgi:hypothetical protein
VFRRLPGVATAVVRRRTPKRDERGARFLLLQEMRRENGTTDDFAGRPAEGPVPSSLPTRVDGEVVGAVGIAGLSKETDTGIANIAAAALVPHS